MPDEDLDGLVDDDGEFQVEPDADLRGESGDDDGDLGTSPPPLTRDGKKRKRYDEMASELSEVKTKLDQVLTRQMPTYQQFAPPQQQPQEDPELKAIDTRIQQNQQRRREMEQVYAAEEARGGMTPQRQQELQGQYRNLESEGQELVVEKVAIKKRPSPQAMAQSAQFMQIRARYPDIVDDTIAYSYASSLMTQELAREAAKGNNKQLNWEDYDRIAEQTRIDLGRKAPPVSDVTKARYSGHAAGGTGQGGGGEEFPAKLDQTDMEMARSVYRDLVKEKGPKAAYAKFWREVKLPQLKEQRARR